MIRESTKGKKRFFVLKGNQLSYYANHNTENSLPKGTIDCSGAAIKEFPFRDNSFTIKEGGGKEFPLCSASFEEKENWVNTLKAVSQNQPPTSTKKEN
ncbi:sesquipedalian [Anaeramoeba flamelloides]|uniref:Sesquipedalian n=1 Tax=Anaeramoeba flamelloides TaxID=1746091 RepID=A0ABQ8YFG9_9EUKA|nr:sesquipedalian [Anaeramoeba flamelloides]